MKAPNFDNIQPLNKLHPEIVKRAPAIQQSEPTMAISGHQVVVFGAVLVEQCKMRIGRYVHFFPAGKLWYFIVNDDITGFPIKPTSKRDATVKINSVPFIRLFRERTGRKENCSFFVQKTKITWQGCPVFEILTAKSRQEIRAGVSK